jgi:cation diffusion facilitator family transporter
MYNIFMKKLRLNFSEKNALIVAFALNFFIFGIELYYGYLENSSALLSDSAHNVGDAIILGTSIFVIYSSQRTKAVLAIFKCTIWGLFGILALYQVYLSYSSGQVPSFYTVGWIGFLALVVNIASTLLLVPFKNNDVNLKSAFVCCRNDAIGNVLIIASGFFVYKLNSSWPDLVAGSLIGIIILFSATKLGLESYHIIKSNKVEVGGKSCL